MKYSKIGIIPIILLLGVILYSNDFIEDSFVEAGGPGQLFVTGEVTILPPFPKIVSLISKDAKRIILGGGAR